MIGGMNSSDLQCALNTWRDAVLQSLRDDLAEADQERTDAEANLGIAARNPEYVADPELIPWLHDTWENACIRADRLDRVQNRIAEMDLPSLLVLFTRTTKLKTHPWEGDAWQLPDYITR
jgi:hypothetical protein